MKTIILLRGIPGAGKSTLASLLLPNKPNCIRSADMYFEDEEGNYNFNARELPTAHKWNILADATSGNPENKLFMLGADDMIFETEGWDKALIDHYNNLENKIHVYALQDSRDVDGTPHIIVTREYIECMGYFVVPIFLHWKIDTWTTEIAKANGVFTHLRDYLLTHDKPSDKGQGDETFSRIRSWGWRERDQYVADKCAHFLEFEKARLARAIKGEHVEWT